jgi:arylamine N-acetyltransferase
LRVQADSSRRLADAGFGAGLLEPVPRDHTGTPQRQGGRTYQLSQTGNNRALRQRIAGQRATLYNFTEEPQHASDVEIASHPTSAYPNSPFAGHTDLSDARPEGPCLAGGAERQKYGAQCAHARDPRSSPAP